MNTNEIKDFNSLIEYIKNYDSKNLDRYVNVVEYYRQNSYHDVYALSVYILKKMETKNIENKFNYFVKSLSSNIIKLNRQSNNQLISNKDLLPNWFNSNISKNLATDIEKNEIDDLLKEFK